MGTLDGRLLSNFKKEGTFLRKFSCFERPMGLWLKITHWLIQAVFDIGIPILGTLIWVCSNSIIGKVKITKKYNKPFNFLGQVIHIN